MACSGPDVLSPKIVGTWRIPDLGLEVRQAELPGERRPPGSSAFRTSNPGSGIRQVPTIFGDGTLMSLAALEWTRPAGLWALALPLVLWLASLRRERPRPTPVGTFELWRALPAGVEGGRTRRRLPPGRALLILALVSGALALGGPRRTGPGVERTVRVVVDPSPSLFLTHTDGSGAPSGEGTRLERALALLAGALGEARATTLEWQRPAPLTVESARSSPFPDAWHLPPRLPRRAPRWERFDAPGTVWLTDRVPDAVPREAGVVASGGGPVPGPVATVGTRWLDWDGEHLVERPGAPERRLVLEGALPEPVAAVARLWAAERGLATDGAGEVALRVVGPMVGPIVGAVDGEVVPAILARDGWSAGARVGRAPSRVEGAPLETWLAARVEGEPRPVVTAGPGRVQVALEHLAEPRGEPAAFAVSWGRLLDRSLRPVDGVVSLAERGAAGDSLVRLPGDLPRDLGAGLDADLDAREPPRPPSWPLVTLLAAAAAALGFLALVAGAGRP